MQTLIWIARVGDFTEQQLSGQITSNGLFTRLDKIQHPERQKEYLAGRFLLMCLADVVCQAHNRATRWREAPDAAPQLASRPDIKFSLSHSNGWVCAICAPSVSALGIDLEWERPRNKLEQLARFSFGDQWVEQLDGPLNMRFFHRWTQCEAIAKTGIRPLGKRLLRDLSIPLPGRGQIEDMQGFSCRLTVANGRSFWLSVCGQGLNQVKTHWYDPTKAQATPAHAQWDPWFVPS